MSALSIYQENQPVNGKLFEDFKDIQQQLSLIGVRFERWSTDAPITKDSDQSTIINAYQQSIDDLIETYGFKSVDVISLNPDHPEKENLRNKFLSEHTHDDFEVRFFIEGKGLFSLHVEDKVYLVLCEQGDLISVPAGTSHWFDMGEAPNFKCIRLFTTPEGWVAKFTGSDIANKFPSLDQFSALLA